MATVREHAEAHGQAMVNKDWASAGGDVVADLQSSLPDIMKQLPRPIESATIKDLSEGDDHTIVHIEYSGPDKTATVESRWEERDGRPMITDLKVL